MSFSGKVREVLENAFPKGNEPASGWTAEETCASFCCFAKLFFGSQKLDDDSYREALGAVELITLRLRHEKGIVISMEELKERQIRFRVKGESGLTKDCCNLTKEIDLLVAATDFSE